MEFCDDAPEFTRAVWFSVVVAVGMLCSSTALVFARGAGRAELVWVLAKKATRTNMPMPIMKSVAHSRVLSDLKIFIRLLLRCIFVHPTCLPRPASIYTNKHANRAWVSPDCGIISLTAIRRVASASARAHKARRAVALAEAGLRFFPLFVAFVEGK